VTMHGSLVAEIPAGECQVTAHNATANGGAE
jgi:hypothetical protein